MNKKIAKRSQKRLGAAAIEFALAAPIVLMLFFAGLEFSRVMVVRNSIQSAAMAGVRTGILPGATNAKCKTAAENMLAAALVKNGVVVVTPATINSGTDEVTVTITVPLTANALPMSKFVIGNELARSVTLRRENHIQ